VPHPDIGPEIDKVRVYISTAEDTVNALGIYPRTLMRYPFDVIAFEIVSKAFALSKACLVLLAAGLADEAFGLSRSLVECAMNLRYMTQAPTELNARTDQFIAYIKADKGYWMHYALQATTDAEMERRIRDHGEQLGVDPDPKSASRHWSGRKGFVWEIATGDHPLDGPTMSERFKRADYAVDYHHTSSFVHCSQPALDNYCPNEKEPFRISGSSGNFYQRGQAALYVVLCHLHGVIAYALFGINMDRPEVLNMIFSDALENLKPVKSQHS
jgi:Family of unknown function (DUF5677)